MRPVVGLGNKEKPNFFNSAVLNSKFPTNCDIVYSVM